MPNSPPSGHDRTSIGSAFAAIKNYFTPERSKPTEEVAGNAQGFGITPLAREFATLTLNDSEQDSVDSFRTSRMDDSFISAMSSPTAAPENSMQGDVNATILVENTLLGSPDTSSSSTSQNMSYLSETLPIIDISQGEKRAQGFSNDEPQKKLKVGESSFGNLGELVDIEDFLDSSVVKTVSNSFVSSVQIESTLSLSSCNNETEATDNDANSNTFIDAADNLSNGNVETLVGVSESSVSEAHDLPYISNKDVCETFSSEIEAVLAKDENSSADTVDVENNHIELKTDETTVPFLPPPDIVISTPTTEPFEDEVVLISPSSSASANDSIITVVHEEPANIHEVAEISKVSSPAAVSTVGQNISSMVSAEGNKEVRLVVEEKPHELSSQALNNSSVENVLLTPEEELIIDVSSNEEKLFETVQPVVFEEVLPTITENIETHLPAPEQQCPGVADEVALPTCEEKRLETIQSVVLEEVLPTFQENAVTHLSEPEQMSPDVVEQPTCEETIETIQSVLVEEVLPTLEEEPAVVTNTLVDMNTVEEILPNSEKHDIILEAVTEPSEKLPIPETNLEMAEPLVSSTSLEDNPPSSAEPSVVFVDDTNIPSQSSNEHSIKNLPLCQDEPIQIAQPSLEVYADEKIVSISEENLQERLPTSDEKPTQVALADEIVLLESSIEIAATNVSAPEEEAIKVVEPTAINHLSSTSNGSSLNPKEMPLEHRQAPLDNEHVDAIPSETSENIAEKNLPVSKEKTIENPVKTIGNEIAELTILTPKDNAGIALPKPEELIVAPDLDEKSVVLLETASKDTPLEITQAILEEMIPQATTENPEMPLLTRKEKAFEPTPPTHEETTVEIPSTLQENTGTSSAEIEKKPIEEVQPALSNSDTVVLAPEENSKPSQMMPEEKHIELAFGDKAVDSAPPISDERVTSFSCFELPQPAVGDISVILLDASAAAADLLELTQPILGDHVQDIPFTPEENAKTEATEEKSLEASPEAHNDEENMVSTTENIEVLEEKPTEVTESANLTNSKESIEMGHLTIEEKPVEVSSPALNDTPAKIHATSEGNASAFVPELEEKPVEVYEPVNLPKSEENQEIMVDHHENPSTVLEPVSKDKLSDREESLLVDSSLPLQTVAENSGVLPTPEKIIDPPSNDDPVHISQLALEENVIELSSDLPETYPQQNSEKINVEIEIRPAEPQEVIDRKEIVKEQGLVLKECPGNVSTEVKEEKKQVIDFKLCPVEQETENVKLEQLHFDETISLINCTDDSKDIAEIVELIASTHVGDGEKIDQHSTIAEQVLKMSETINDATSAVINQEFPTESVNILDLTDGSSSNTPENAEKETSIKSSHEEKYSPTCEEISIEEEITTSFVDSEKSEPFYVYNDERMAEGLTPILEKTEFSFDSSSSLSSNDKNLTEKLPTHIETEQTVYGGLGISAALELDTTNPQRIDNRKLLKVMNSIEASSISQGSPPSMWPEEIAIESTPQPAAMDRVKNDNKLTEVSPILHDTSLSSPVDSPYMSKLLDQAMLQSSPETIIKPSDVNSTFALDVIDTNSIFSLEDFKSLTTSGNAVLNLTSIDTKIVSPVLNSTVTLLKNANVTPEIMNQTQTLVHEVTPVFNGSTTAAVKTNPKVSDNITPTLNSTVALPQNLTFTPENMNQTHTLVNKVSPVFNGNTTAILEKASQESAITASALNSTVTLLQNVALTPENLNQTHILGHEVTPVFNGNATATVKTNPKVSDNVASTLNSTVTLPINVTPTPENMNQTLILGHEVTPVFNGNTTATVKTNPKVSDNVTPTLNSTVTLPQNLTFTPENMNQTHTLVHEVKPVFKGNTTAILEKTSQVSGNAASALNSTVTLLQNATLTPENMNQTHTLVHEVKPIFNGNHTATLEKIPQVSSNSSPYNFDLGINEETQDSENWNGMLQNDKNKNKKMAVGVLKEINDNNIVDKNMGSWLSSSVQPSQKVDKVEMNEEFRSFDLSIFNTALQPTSGLINRDSLYIKFDPLYQPTSRTTDQTIFVKDLKIATNEPGAKDEQKSARSQKDLQEEVARLKALYMKREEERIAKEEELKLKTEEWEEKCQEAQRTLEQSLQRQQVLEVTLSDFTASNQKLEAFATEAKEVVLTVQSHLEERRKAPSVAPLMDHQSIEQHVKSAEAAFMDVSEKYEKLQNYLGTLKSNMEQHEKEARELTQQLKHLDERSQECITSLKIDLDEKSRIYQAEVEKFNSEASCVTAKLRKSQLSLNTAQESLNKVTNENENLALLCDDIIAGNS